MPSLLSKVLARRSTAPITPARHITSLDDYLGTINGSFGFGVTGGLSYPLTEGYGANGGMPSGLTGTYGSQPSETIANNLNDYARCAYEANGVVFAVMAVRMLVFSAVRFQWQRINRGRPSEMFGSRDLAVLEQPWVGGTTQDLLKQMIQDADLAGNSYWVDAAQVGAVESLEGRRIPGPQAELVRLRPDWVQIVLEPRGIRGGQVGWRRLGYVYWEGGFVDPVSEPVAFLPDEIVHFAPNPDNLANYRGMSWLTPVLREIVNDKAMGRHQSAFFENAAPQPCDAGVLTPDGWVEMGDIKLGDRVFGPDGKPRHVTGVFPQGERDIYRVTFSSGATTECTDDHLWTVANAYDRKRGVTRTLPLAELVKDGIRYSSGPYKWSVPLVDPLEFDDPGELPLDPYLLGSLLGDGSFRSNGKGSGGVSLASHRDDADEQERLLSALLPEGVSISRRDRGGWAEFYFKGAGGPKPNPLTQAVRALGMFDVPGREKRIPEQYLRASVNERVALLQGLIDTDGSVNRKQPNTVRFDSTSERLARQLSELAASLGAVTSVKAINRNEPGRRQQWHVVISRLPEWIVPCRLARKAELYSENFRGGRWRYIQSVEYVGRKPAQCIKVDSDDSLYVTDDFILTHNTPNLSVSLDKDVSLAAFSAFKEAMDAGHQGPANAYKTLYLGGGADVKVIGADFQAMDFTSLKGHGETRIAAAGGVPPVIVGLSEGLQAATYSNYAQARRRLADGTIHPLWQDVTGSLANIVPRPTPANGSGGEVRLWYDARDVPFLREDQKDAAEIQARQASTINTFITAGFEPDTAVQAVMAEDFALLKHTGLTSVQLVPPSDGQPSSDQPAPPAPNPAPSGTDQGE